MSANDAVAILRRVVASNPGQPAEGYDIYDTIKWIAEQPRSNGKVGMGGAFSFSIVQ